LIAVLGSLVTVIQLLWHLMLSNHWWMYILRHHLLDIYLLNLTLLLNSIHLLLIPFICYSPSCCPTLSYLSRCCLISRWLCCSYILSYILLWHLNCCWLIVILNLLIGTFIHLLHHLSSHMGIFKQKFLHVKLTRHIHTLISILHHHRRSLIEGWLWICNFNNWLSLCNRRCFCFCLSLSLRFRLCWSRKLVLRWNKTRSSSYLHLLMSLLFFFVNSYFCLIFRGLWRGFGFWNNCFYRRNFTLFLLFRRTGCNLSRSLGYVKCYIFWFFPNSHWSPLRLW
jgi:hypothetical protein